MHKEFSLACVIYRIYHRHPWLSVIPFILLTAASCFLLPHVRSGGVLHVELPEDDPYRLLSESIEKRFASSEFLLLSVQGRDLADGEALEVLASLCDRIEALPEIESVLSVTTTRDMVLQAEELHFVPLYVPREPGVPAVSRQETRDLLRNGNQAVAATPEELVTHVKDTRLFREYFISRDGSAWNAYLFLKPGADRTRTGRLLESEVHRGVQEDSGVSVYLFGNTILEYFALRGILQDFFRIGGLALAVILVVEMLVTGSMITGALLCLASALPAIWVTALFPLLGLRLEIPSVIAPIIVLILATTYSIHLYRYYSLESDGNMAVTLDRAGPVILTAAATTMFGFLSLLVSPLEGLRELAAPLIIGIILAALSAIFVVPRVLEQARRYVFSRSLPLPEPWTWKSRKWVLAVFLLAIVVCVSGIFRIGNDFRMDVRFTRSSETGKLIDAYYRLNGGMDDLDIVVDTGVEYGLVDPERFLEIAEFVDGLREIHGVSRVVSFTDFIMWANSRMAGDNSPYPEDEYALGELMELLYGADAGIGLATLIDPEYRRFRIQVRFGIRAVTVREAQALYAALRDEIDSGMGEFLPGLGYEIIGLPVRHDHTMEYLVRGVGFSLLFFFPLLWALLMLLFKSARWAAYALVPPVFSILFYSGFLGITGIPLNTATAFMIAAVLGVTNDDVLCFLLFLRRELPGTDLHTALRKTMAETGAAIIQTTVVIIAGLAALLISTYPTIIQATAASMVTFAACTTVTLVIVPILTVMGLRKGYGKPP